MGKIKIIADSGCDLDLSYVNELEAHIIPLTVHIGEENYYDRVTIEPGVFYKKINEIREFPKTSQITPPVFIDEFKKFLDEGFDIIYISLSSGLSGTYQSACIAREMLGSEKIKVIDSKGASVGYGLMVREASLMVKKGKSVEEIVDKVEFMRDRMEYIFAVGSLDMLKRGGRISTAQAVMGKLLNVKPILQFKDGVIVPYDKVRGEKGIINKMIETMKERGHDIGNQIIGLNYAGDTDICMRLRDEIAAEFGVKEFVISEIGAVIGAHVGTGTVAVFFLKK